MEFLNIFLPVIIPVFLIMCGAYFWIDICCLARDNDKLKAENKALKRRVKELTR